MAPLILTVIAKVPVSGVQAFQDYEAIVLPLLAEHGGVLQRRLRNGDGTREVHIVSFASSAAFAGFRSDPRRLAAAGLLAASGAENDVLEVFDV